MKRSVKRSPAEGDLLFAIDSQPLEECVTALHPVPRRRPVHPTRRIVRTAPWRTASRHRAPHTPQVKLVLWPFVRCALRGCHTRRSTSRGNIRAHASVCSSELRFLDRLCATLLPCTYS